MRTRVALGFLSALTLLACSEAHSGSDGGGSRDSGSSDHDAATALDAATHVDAGSPSDAGTSADAATPRDASTADSGSLEDASAASDAGPPCAFIESIDRRCLSDDECAVAMHQVNCCGTFVATGISASEAESFAGLEAACEASYPGCGCATQPTTTDSGETVGEPSTVQVACITRGPGGICMTYVTERPADGH